VKKPVMLADTCSAEDWERFCLALLDDPEPGMYEIANAAKKARLAGWLGDTEVMLTNPKKYL
jgi:hypothetical protein